MRKINNLLEYFTLGVRRDTAAVTAERKPLGYFQWTVTTAATLASQIPQAVVTAMQNAGMTPGYAVIQQNVASAAVRWRDDGTAPTAAIGMYLGQAELDYAGDIYTIQFVLSTGSPILDVSLYA
jgi:hypothetical protein